MDEHWGEVPLEIWMASPTFLFLKNLTTITNFNYSSSSATYERNVHDNYQIWLGTLTFRGRSVSLPFLKNNSVKNNQIDTILNTIIWRMNIHLK